VPFTSSLTGSFTGGRRANTESFGSRTIKKNGLIVHYDASDSTSYGGSGTTFTDLTSNANNGTIVGGPTFSSDKFIWTSSDYIVTPSIADHITGVDPAHTTEVLCKPTDNGVVVCYAGQSNPLTGYHFSAIEIVSGNVEFGIWTGSGITSSGATESIEFGRWYHLCLTYNGSRFKGFINGTQVCNVTATWDDPMGSTGSFHVAFGTSDITNQGDGTTFDGDFRYMRIYDHALRRPAIRRNINKASRDVTVNQTVESFTTTGESSWIAPLGVTSVEYLVVGGGGGGGNGYDTGGGGGGSAGVVRTGTRNVRPNKTYDLTVGAGGAGGADTRANRNGSDGEDSIFANITSAGGDAGNGSRTVQRSHGDGGDAQAGSTVGQGGDGGGNASSATAGSGGGGGGAGGAGGNGSSGVGGAGGSGTSSSISGSSVTYGAGGAGARGNFNTTEGANGTANRGNGGGGGGAASFNSGGGGTGGSGIVILKWGQAAWDPSIDITPAIWFDASDTDSYTLSGSNVTAVTDKAGNATVTVNGTPNTSNTLDSKNVFTFVPDEDFTTDEVAQASSGNHWAIGVMQWNTIDNTKDSFWSTENNSESVTNKRDYAISSGNSSAFDGELDLDALLTNRISSTIGNKQDFDSGIAQNTWVIVCAIFNKTGNQIAVRVNGTNAFTPVNDYDNALNTNMDLRIFRNRASQRMGGRMAEFFTVADVPGTGGTDITDVIKAEGYLAHKWGLEGNLPSGHAYKSSAP